MAASGAVSGELGLIGLYDLGQLLMLNRATGRLAIEHEGRRAALLFRDGRIVNAVDEELREGENAACKVFAWRAGRFEFFAESVGPANNIECGTEALMLEAARRQDEAGQATGDPGSAEARVRDRQNAMEALRDVFHDVARSARHGGTASAPAYGGVSLDALGRAGDRLVLRPGRPARLRVDGAWREVRDAGLSAADYEDLKLRLLGPIGVREAASGERPTRLATLPGERRAAVTLMASGPDESLWLRPVHLPAPEPDDGFRGSKPLAQVLALPRAVIVVCGADLDVARERVHQIASELHARPNECLLLARDLPVYRHPERAGILAECGPAELATGLAAVQPQTVVLDLDQALPEDALQGIDPVRRVIARVPGTTANAVNAAWRVRFNGRDRERFAAHTGSWPTYLMRIGGRDGDAPGFEVWQLAAGALAPLAGEQALARSPGADLDRDAA